MTTTSKHRTKGIHFSDGVRPVDYVLVYSRKKLKTNYQIKQLEGFVQNLQKIGFEYETHPFSCDRDIKFVLLTISEDKLLDFAEAYKIDLTMNSILYNFEEHTYGFTKTFLTDPDLFDDLYKRAEETFSKQKPNGLTSSEKIFLICEILKKNRYGEKVSMYGVRSLIKAGTLRAAFAIHSGTYKWTKKGPLTDRQVLYEYWAHPKRFYKAQPANVIERYFGTETAFYYKWMGLYATMLAIPAIISVAVVIFGVGTQFTYHNTLSIEICQSKLLLCPSCPSCKYEHMRRLCAASHLTYILNNNSTVLFAVVISLWSTVVVEMWKRIEATNQMRWNVKNLEQDFSMRMEYKERAYYREIADGTLEPFIPLTSWLFRTTATLLSVTLTAAIIVCVTIFTQMLQLKLTHMMYDNTHPYKTDNYNWVIFHQFLNCSILAGFMIILQKLYYRVAFKITHYENPRTEVEFDNSYIYKCYLLNCFNHYFALLFIGFGKGQAFQHPGIRVNEFQEVFIAKCMMVFGCTLEMGILQLSIWIIHGLIKFVENIFVPIINVKVKMIFRKKPKDSTGEMPQWEHDFFLYEPDPYHIPHAYLDTVVEYGLVTFFISAFPLAPLCAFIKNIFHLRFEALRALGLYRRPNPRKVAKLVCFTKLLQATTYLGIVANAGMIAFSSNFVPKILYWHYIDSSLNGFSNFTMSQFLSSGVYSMYKYNERVHEKYCFYGGLRNAVNANDYTLHHWWILSIRFATLLAIEHFVFLVQGLLSYMIPDVPYSVKEEIAHQQKMRREQRMRDIEATFINKRKKAITESERFVLLK
ncbi:anoctamin-3-like [Aethina tumida]|uniref:anoctamin-3-like n=1 Tax=Aethina tumida TaxID=116153 RepID=UPI00214880C8|nr:anoctamin-3-like [Aethina tumida]